MCINIIVAFLILLMMASSVMAAETITVDDSGGKDYTGIQAAVNAASAGDTIIVYPGTYHENVVLYQKSLNIYSYSGNPADTSVISPSPNQPVFNIFLADKVTITGFTISRSWSNRIGSGILLDGDYGTFSNNIIEKQQYGIFFWYSNYNTISNNIVKNNNYGIFLDNCHYSLIYNNFFNNSGYNAYDYNPYPAFGLSIYNITKTAGINIVGGPYLGGNYWAKPDGNGFSQICTDDNGDGICDSAYNIGPALNKDKHPLASAPTNQPPIADIGGPYTGIEGMPILFSSSSTDPDGDSITCEWQFDDGTVNNNCTFSHTWFDDYSGTVTLRVTDSNGAQDTESATVMVNNIAPSIVSIGGIPINPVPVGTTIYPSATFIDSGTLDTHNAYWNWSGLEGTSDGIVDQSIGSAIGNHTYNNPGIYSIKLTVTDDDGGSDTTKAIHYLVVYDSESGFVTGGGGIDSPTGTFIADPTLEGRANFGFVSKYKKGATTPTGQTEFQFKVADLNFHSGIYDWLVIAGHKAMYKGTGTINGEGNYGFILFAIDEELTPSTDVDLFRIKIWDKANNDKVVYDNQMGDTDDADPTTEVMSGSIVIHKEK